MAHDRDWAGGDDGEGHDTQGEPRPARVTPEGVAKASMVGKAHGRQLSLRRVEGREEAKLQLASVLDKPGAQSRAARALGVTPQAVDCWASLGRPDSIAYGDVLVLPADVARPLLRQGLAFVEGRSPVSSRPLLAQVLELVSDVGQVLAIVGENMKDIEDAPTSRLEELLQLVRGMGDRLRSVEQRLVEILRQRVGRG